jgi:hypothetical protein
MTPYTPLAWDNFPPHIKALHWAENRSAAFTDIQKAMVRGFLAQHVAQQARNKDPTNKSTIHNPHPQVYTSPREP